MILTSNYKKIISEMALCPDWFAHNKKYIRVLNDQLADVLNEEVFSKMRTKQGKADKKAMSINVNYLKKIVNKKSQIYTFDAERKFSSNQDIVDYYQKYSKIDTQLQKGTQYYNATKSVLMEISYNKKYQIMLIPIPNDRYYLWTSDKVDTTTPEVYVKIIERILYKCDNTGKDVEADLYFMWSEDEFLAVDSAGKIWPEYMPNGPVNVLGFLPFVHVNQDSDNIIPQNDKDTLSTLLQVNSVLTDAVVATFYQSFPLITVTGADAKTSKINRNANDVMFLNSPAGSTTEPKINVVQPNLNTDNPIKLSKEILELTMDSMGLKVNSGTAKANISSVQELINATDITEIRKMIINDWIPADEEVWEKIALMHNWLVKNKLALMPKKAPKKFFNEDFEVETDFPLPDTNAEVIKESQGKNDVSKESNGEATENSN